MTLREACKSALTILKQVMEEKLNATNVEVGLTYIKNISKLFYFLIGSTHAQLSCSLSAIALGMQ